jgi:hypothetical protein
VIVIVLIVNVPKDFIALSMNVFGAAGIIVIVLKQNHTVQQKVVVLNALVPFIVIVATIASIINV